ncbi:MAG: alanine--tRNA ligase, partial [Candidatus Cloacimonetes bacterium]|nr:alanine--tRNA ligase [Candidatus Cloacimonadota bacterium]
MLTSREIRKQFIDFFVSKGHEAVPSAPVIPHDDPTLLFTNAGMNQFKNIFLSEVEPTYTRAVDSQKCIRAGGKHNDLDEVGRDGYHHTFFEMLGNWSFGDYYKKEAITWAWELITGVWKLPKDKIYATVHDTDSEAFEIWKNYTDIDPEHISYHGDKDNFWEMGDTGPCGPCSEIHFDRGAEHCGIESYPGHVCKVNGDCHRYIELWNLVFMQYFRAKDGSLSPLKKKHVDTGAGFERICQVLQKKTSNYATDLFSPIIDHIADISGVPYSEGVEGIPHRVIADHIRALSFSISDGGIPSNEGRGYVIRRILRRAARMGRVLNLKEPFLYKIVDTVIEIMGHHFTGLKQQKDYVKMIIKGEEERFNLTLDKGLAKFEEMIVNAKEGYFPGSDAFMLYDTFGFPLDLTSILAEEKGLKVDEKQFNTLMEEQKERARSASAFKLDVEESDWVVIDKESATEFVGYTQTSSHSYIRKYKLNDDNYIVFVTDKTPLYAESGGQIADRGIVSADNLKIDVEDVKKSGDLFIHYGRLVKGIPSEQMVTITVDLENRSKIAANHTATHLLHAALKKVLGEHVQQKGSLVTADNLRFDFTHFQGMTPAEIAGTEDLVNAEIRKGSPVATDIMSQNKAKEEGATALFGEKYGDNVRVVSIDSFSKELCGGTHVAKTSNIGNFKIISESSSSAGIRRIEAITGQAVINYYKHLEVVIDDASELLKTRQEQLIEKIESLLSDYHELKNEMKSLKSQAAGSEINDIVNMKVLIGDVSVAAGKVKIDNSDELRNAGDILKQKLGSGIGILFAVINDKVSILTVVSEDMKTKYPAGKIVGKLAELVGGKGGGRPDMAMAGGKDIEKID